MGGKSGKVAAETPMEFMTATGIGLEGGPGKTFEDIKGKDRTIEKKKLGTRGLQIPLVADTTNTDIASTAPGTGVQI